MSDNKKESMFAKLAQQNAKASQGDTVPVADVVTHAPPPPPAPSEAASPKRQAGKKKPDPVKGKRNHPDYRQANAYIPKKLRRLVDREILEMDGQDYSSLIEELLTKWLKSRGVDC